MAFSVLQESIKQHVLAAIFVKDPMKMANRKKHVLNMVLRNSSESRYVLNSMPSMGGRMEASDCTSKSKRKLR